MDSVRNYPKLSLRRRSVHLGISKSLIQKILKQRKFHPYKPIFNHALEPGDPAKRLYFCLWMGAQIMDNQYFYRNIIFSDEATFSTNGTVASQHVRYWSDYNPNFRMPHNLQYSAKVNVCVNGVQFLTMVSLDHIFLIILSISIRTWICCKILLMNVWTIYRLITSQGVISNKMVVRLIMLGLLLNG